MRVEDNPDFGCVSEPPYTRKAIEALEEKSTGEKKRYLLGEWKIEEKEAEEAHDTIKARHKETRVGYFRTEEETK